MKNKLPKTTKRTTLVKKEINKEELENLKNFKKDKSKKKKKTLKKRKTTTKSLKDKDDLLDNPEEMKELFRDALRKSKDMDLNNIKQSINN